LSALTKQSILDHLLNEYPNFREKIQLNIKRCELSFYLHKAKYMLCKILASYSVLIKDFFP